MSTNIATDEFPYQIVAMFGCSPQLSDFAYGAGERQWYPQVTFKRRFGLRTLTEPELLARIEGFAAATAPFKVVFGEVVRRYLPVRVVEVVNEAPREFHHNLLALLGHKITSRYPDREAENYYPHMTIEWDGRPVVDAGRFVQTTHIVQRVWLLKDDVRSDDSRIYAHFDLTGI